MFRIVDDVPEKQGMDLWKQMSSSKCSFTCTWGIVLPLTLPRLQSMLGLHFTPACVLLLVCSLHFTHSLHFTPGPQSAVRSPQSSFYTDWFSNFQGHIILSKSPSQQKFAWRTDILRNRSIGCPCQGNWAGFYLGYLNGKSFPLKKMPSFPQNIFLSLQYIS